MKSNDIAQLLQAIADNTTAVRDMAESNRQMTAALIDALSEGDIDMEPRYSLDGIPLD
jgi:hypothetical protein